MEGEFRNLFGVWFTVITSLCYCHAVGKLIPKGINRLFSILPIVLLFLHLPLKLSTVNLGGLTGFFIGWLCNFKLLLFAFDKGPLSPSATPLSLPAFVAIACLPIKPAKLQENTGPSKNGRHQQKPPPQNPRKSRLGGFTGLLSLLNYPMKALLLALVVRAYEYQDRFFHPKLVYVLYCFHVYLALELTLAALAATAQAGFGMELEPQFHEPYLASSLRDFWGRRWNIMVAGALRATVYDPVRRAVEAEVGREWAALPAVMAAFLVSGLMHELMVLYIGHVWDTTWETTWFFVFHGVCLVAEVAIKNALGWSGVKWRRLPAVVSGGLTVAFVAVTASWWFSPPLLRIGAETRALEEYAAAGTFVKDASRAVASTIFN